MRRAVAYLGCLALPGMVAAQAAPDPDVRPKLPSEVAPAVPLAGPVNEAGEAIAAIDSQSWNALLVRRIQACWNVGAVEEPVVVTVRFFLDEATRVIDGAVTLDAELTEVNAQSFEVARRAVLRCGTDGFGLSLSADVVPREVLMTFDPTKVSYR